MGSLRRKLGRLQMPGKAPAPAGLPAAPPNPPVARDAGTGEGSFGSGDRAARLARLRVQMAVVEQRAQQTPRASVRGPHVLGEGLPGERQTTVAGPLRTVRTVLAEDHRHGAAPVAAALSACANELSVLALDPSIAEADLTRALYVDTETTGLSGGAGTVPFLIGVAFFEGSQLVVEQYLLEQLGQEGPMLARLSELLEGASCVVSYNGKSFDWPLLRTRLVMHRVAARPPAVHIDLLHCARRVFKRRLGAVRLVHIEQEVLGFSRVDDIPGALIPDTYLRYLRQHVPGEALAPIVEHNRHDLVALAALLGELSRRFSQGGAGQDARDQLGMAQTAARARQTDRAIQLAQAAADADLRGELASQAAYLAGRWAKQQGDYRAAAQAFEQALGHARCAEEAALAHLELAKLHEHQLRAWPDALAHAERTAPAEGPEACARRVARLTRRISRLSTQG